MNTLIDPVDEDLHHLAEAKPVLKWAGGKTQLKDVILKAIDRLHPEPIGHYYEPFAGGLAIFFALRASGRIQEATLSDTNEELINFYLQIQNSPKALIAALAKLKKEGSGEAHYKWVRASMPSTDAARAARFKYINARGYNGLWRVNKNNECNVPYGHHKNPPEILHEAAIWAAHQAFQDVIIRCVSYHGVCLELAVLGNARHFLYLDPPYWPTRPTANFTSYTAEGFVKRDQEILAEHMKTFARVGISALLSNSSVPETRKLYRELKSKKVSARRNINSVGTDRGAVQELLVESTFRKK
jgi:DNA adenine methylase